jgi:hypothetical protein
MNEDYGRSRVFAQWLNTEDDIQCAIGAWDDFECDAMRCDAIDLVPRRRVAVLIFDFMS